LIKEDKAYGELKNAWIGLAVGSILKIPVMLYVAWTITVLWGWFVTEYFNSQPLTLRVVIGLLIIFAMISGKLPERDIKYSVGSVFVVNMGYVIYTTTVLFIGFIFNIILG